MRPAAFRPLSVFIAVSNEEEDKNFSEELRRHLQPLNSGELLTCWFSNLDPSPGRERTEQIKEQCKQADLFLFLLSIDFINSSECQYITELAFEREHKKFAQIFCINLREFDLVETAFQHRPLLPRNRTSIKSSSNRDQAWEEIIDQVNALVPIVSPLPTIRNPYKGLRAFQPDEADDFFGRTEVVKALFARLKDNQTRLLMVMGSSGVGKSSVVLAGLLPHLHQENLNNKERWVVLPYIRLGNNPLRALATALATGLPSTLDKGDEIYNRLKVASESGYTLDHYVRLIARKASPEAKVILMIDQFEDLFQLGIHKEERRDFLDLLLEAIQISQAPLCVIFTLRSDFLTHLSGFPKFANMAFKHHYEVLGMSPEEMRTAIKEPASRVHVHFNEQLVNAILEALHGQKAALPMLQFALEQLFEAREGYRITRNAYDRIGGVKGAIRKHAEETYESLPDEQHRQWVRKIFLHLVNLEVSNQEIITRRRVLQSDLIALADSADELIVQTSIDAFVRAGLLTASGVEDVTTTTSVIVSLSLPAAIEIGHEAVLEAWSRLNEWVVDNHSNLHLRGNLDNAIEEWEYNHRASTLLYNGLLLKGAEEWSKLDPPTVPEREFLRASRQEETARFRRRFLRWFLVVAVIMASIGGAAWWVTHPIFVDPTLVTNTNDSGEGSLRWCLQNAPAGSTITVAAKVRGTITLKNTLTINKSLTIKGSGENVLSLRGPQMGASVDITPTITGVVSISAVSFTQGGSSTVSIDPMVIEVEQFSTLYLNHVIIAHNYGTGIDNAGAVTLSNATIADNVASSFAGGVFNRGTMMIANTTITGNSLSNNGGVGGVLNGPDAIMTIANSTIADNSSSGVGGITNVGAMTIANSTITNNTSPSVAGIDTDLGGKTTLIFCTFVENRGQGIALGSVEEENVNTVIMQDTILVSTPIVVRDSYAIFQSKGYNLVDIVNAHFFQQSSDRVIQDPFDLFENGALLEQNGGATQTIKLRTGSEASNAIPVQACHIQGIYNKQASTYTDQRGQPRPGQRKMQCDIGAYETQ